MKKVLWILLVSACTWQLSAQTTARGVVKDAGTGEPVIGVKVTLLQQNISTRTNTDGEFYFTFLEAGSDELSFVKEGYFNRIMMVELKGNEETDLGDVKMRPDIQEELKQDIILQLSEAQLDGDDEGSQSIGASFSSSNDVYISQTSYNFSPMRFRTRGYDGKYESTYINGVRFVDAERGLFNYSSLGGLNNATRNKDLTYGLAPNTYSYGNLGANTNINTRASAFATGSNLSGSLSNRSYMLRGQYTYGTGVLPSGWAFAVSGVIRWSKEGIVDGTFYNSAGLFLSAEKIFNDRHRLSLVAYGAPTRRAQQGGVVQEVYDLAGSIYYNPYWGYQNGKKRNSRIVESFDPTAILSHVWKIDEKSSLRSGIAFHYSKYSNSALSFSNKRDPRPDYYRYLPSFTNEQSVKDELASYWASGDPRYTQIDWDELYLANQNATINPEKQSLYYVERRHNDLMETALNSTYTNQFTNFFRLNAGIEGRLSKGMHYKTMEDLLGADGFYDVDTYAERDETSDFGLPDYVKYNNFADFTVEGDPSSMKRKGEGDVFGYNYDMHYASGSAFALGEFSFSHLDFYVGAQLTYTQFYRYGHMDNGRVRYLVQQKGETDVRSLGKSQTWFFTDPSVKAGLTYKIDGRNRLSANVLAETRAPLVRDSYVSERIKDTRVSGLQSEKILSYDLNYTFSYPFLRGRVSAFRTHVLGGTEKLGYYDDGEHTFINHVLTDADKIYQGVEIGLSAPIAWGFSVSAAATFADYHYTSNAWGTKSYENGAKDDVSETVYTKGLKINNGPQLAANITLDYFHPKMWFVDITLNYFGNNYLDFAPNRFTESTVALYGCDMSKVTSSNLIAAATTEEAQAAVRALGTQEKLKGGFMLDASIGKLIYLKNRKSLNFNLSLSNILNNREMITGGYQQGRLPWNNSDNVIDRTALNKFPNKYYYAWGFNFFFNVGYKF